MSGALRAHRAILLGPQTPHSTLGSVYADLVKSGVSGADDAVPTITAGWQEREGEDADLDAELAGRSANLRLYQRAYGVFERDVELARAHRAAQDRLKLLRRSYNARLAHLIEAWREIGRLDGEAELLADERAAALEFVRALDARHLERVREVRAEFDRAHSPGTRDTVRRHRDEIAALLEDAPVVVIAGGHVVTLLNRLRLFGLREALADRTLVAWSAGAMALGPRVVLFHDRPPQGPGNAEAFENGLELYPDLIPFPHAAKRLLLEDRLRIGRLARRFAPSACALLESETRLEWSEDGWRALSGGLRLTVEGHSVSFDADEDAIECNGWRGGSGGGSARAPDAGLARASGGRSRRASLGGRRWRKRG